MKKMLLAVVAMSLGAQVLAAPAHAADGNLADAVNRKVLRVCSIPENMPYSNDKGEGFENKIAEVIADELKIPVEYTWYPGGFGLIRRTLAAKKCGSRARHRPGRRVHAQHQPLLSHDLRDVFQKGSDLEGVTSFTDPKLQGKRVSNQGGPIGDQIAKAGLMPNAKSYLINVDRRYLNPEQEIIDDVIKGEIDVGVLWGPLRRLVLEAAPRQADGCSHHRARTRHGKARLPHHDGRARQRVNWKRQLNEIIKKRQGDIDKILLSFNVPILDEDLKPITAPRN